MNEHPMKTFVLLSKVLFLAPLLPSPPSRQRFGTETSACWSCGAGRTSAGQSGWWPAGRGSSRLAASGWTRTAALCSPLWPREAAISETLDRRQGGPGQRQKLAEAQRKIKAKKKHLQSLAGWTVRDSSSHCRVLLLYCFTELLPSVKWAIIFYLAGRLFKISILLSSVFLQKMLKELRVLCKPEWYLLAPLYITLKMNLSPHQWKNWTSTGELKRNNSRLARMCLSLTCVFHMSQLSKPKSRG